jgi:hypothetical protein
MLGGSYKDGTWTSAFRGTNDGAKVDYEYVPGRFPQPAIYRLLAIRNSPGFVVLLSVAGKISSDRLASINDAIKEFDTTKKPVVRSTGDFKRRGDFRVKVDENTLELENLWKSKGM